MPVIVETDVVPSKRRYVIIGIPILGGALFLITFNAHSVFLIAWLSLAVPLVAMQRSELQPSHLRFDGADVTLWQENNTTRWRWLAQGRLSYAFIEFHLVGSDEQSLRLRIWRDSISDASWRALKMAYRVNRVGVLSDINST